MKNPQRIPLGGAMVTITQNKNSGDGLVLLHVELGESIFVSMENGVAIPVILRLRLPVFSKFAGGVKKGRACNKQRHGQNNLPCHF